MKIFTQIIEKPLLKDSEHDTVSLTFDERKRGRLKVVTDKGNEAGIQIERGKILRDGTVLTNDSGDFLTVKASCENVSTAYIENPTLFARGCYHLGNRHVALQIGERFLRYQEDYVLDDMLQGLGIRLEHENAPFEPEQGAYSHGNPSSRHHGHDHERE